MDSGPHRWSDEMLSQVADHLLKIGRQVNNVRYLIPVVDELDRRGSVARARKLLRLMPENALSPDLPAGSLAAIVAFSRKHQIPELLSEPIPDEWLTKELLDWLSIEDITWIIQSHSGPPGRRQLLLNLVRADPRFRRLVNGATELFTE